MSQQGHRVLATLRQMIIDRRFEPGVALSELGLAELLGVSRTPIRLAVRALHQEGMLIKLPGRGYTVRDISDKDVLDAIQVRETLEGLAARLVAERGLSAAGRAVLLDCLRAGDTLFAKGHITEADLAAYHDINMTFHSTIIAESGNQAIAAAIAHNDHLPFAASSSIAYDAANLRKEFRRFDLANMQHHVIFDALDNGQGTRAEAIMREHANVAIRYMELFGAGRMPLNGAIKVLRPGNDDE